MWKTLAVLATIGGITLLTIFTLSILYNPSHQCLTCLRYEPPAEYDDGTPDQPKTNSVSRRITRCGFTEIPGTCNKMWVIDRNHYVGCKWKRVRQIPPVCTHSDKIFLTIGQHRLLPYVLLVSGLGLVLTGVTIFYLETTNAEAY